MNFELDEILTIIEKVKTTDLESFEYQDTDTKIKIRGRKSQMAAFEPAFAVSASNMNAAVISETSKDVHTIEAPMVGTFYAAPAEDAEPFVKPGDVVKKGQTVCIIEAMKLMNEVVSDVDGIVEAVLAENESMVEFGQPMIQIRNRG